MDLFDRKHAAKSPSVGKGTQRTAAGAGGGGAAKGGFVFLSCYFILVVRFKIDGGLIENIVTVVDYFLFNNVLGRGRIGTRVQGQSGRGEPRWVG